MTSDLRIDGYAAAILEVAKAEGELARVGDEMFRIARAFESSAELRDAHCAARSQRATLQRRTRWRGVSSRGALLCPLSLPRCQDVHA